MKLKKIFALLAFPSIFFLASCEKETEPDPELDTTFKLAEDQAISESINDDATVVFFEATVGAGLYRVNGTVETTNTLSCATVTVTPQNEFPKTIVIDFGTGGCVSADQIGRKGKINITLTDYLHNPGSVATITFEDYYTAGFKVEGTITWTNTSTANDISWTRQITNGRVIEPIGGYYWLHTGTKYVTQTAGGTTPSNLLDDVYSITGDHTVTNPAGKTRTVTIQETLEKKTTCHNVTKGTMKVQGPTHFAILDFGDGTCDNIATVTIDGNPSRTILLP